MVRDMKKAEKVAVVGIIAAAALGALIAWAGSDRGETVGGVKLFALLVIIAFAVNIAAFVPSFVARTEHYYDLTGSLTYISLTIFAIALSSDLDVRSVIIAVLVLTWAGRLGSFLFRRVKRVGKDGRFDVIKHNLLRFLMFWVIQGLWVTVTAGAALAALSLIHI